MYKRYAEQLINKGKAYYAFDTNDELNYHRKDHERKGKTFIYNWHNREKLSNSISLTKEEVEKKIANGEDYVVRFKMYDPSQNTEEEVIAKDLIRGNVSFKKALLDDKVLFKQDGMPTYHLANIVDDHFMEISHVIRGEEWLPSVPLHIELYKALDWEIPKFAHLPLIMKPVGKGKLSKRDGDKLGIPVFPLEWHAADGEKSSGYRESGFMPNAVVNLLAMLGWHPADNKELFTIDELVQAFSLERVSKSGAKFDIDKAKWYNHQYLLSATSDELLILIKDDLEPMHTANGQEYLVKVLDMLKEKVSFANEILPLGEYFFTLPTKYDEGVQNKKWNPEVANHIHDYVNELVVNKYASATEMEQHLQSYADDCGINKGTLMQPLRWAISGQAGGPPIFEMMELIGLDSIAERVKIARMKHAL